MRLGLHAFAAVLVVAAFAALPAAPDTSTGAGRSEAGRACTPTWRTSASPSIRQGTLNAVAAVSPRDAWAVGGVVRLGGITGGEVVAGAPLIEHWNGVHWSVTPIPKLSGVLTDVAATSRRNAWAVGFVPGARRPLVLRWDARRWSQVNLPREVRATDAVAVLSAEDVWTTGTLRSGDTGEISHWDGRQWTRLVARRNSSLADVAALSQHDIWAVGTAGTDLDEALTLHWDGSTWKSFVRRATTGNDYAWLLSVAVTATNDVWAGGGEHLEELSPPAIAPLMLHWDGRRWSYARIPNPGETELTGLAPTAPDEVWAVSSNSWSYEEQGSFGYGTWHRTGGRWHVSELPLGWELYDIAAPRGRGASRAVWAVGQVGSAIQDYATRTVPLIRRYGC